MKMRSGKGALALTALLVAVAFATGFAIGWYARPPEVRTEVKWRDVLVGYTIFNWTTPEEREWVKWSVANSWPFWCNKTFEGKCDLSNFSTVPDKDIGYYYIRFTDVGTGYFTVEFEFYFWVDGVWLVNLTLWYSDVPPPYSPDDPRYEEDRGRYWVAVSLIRGYEVNATKLANITVGWTEVVGASEENPVKWFFGPITVAWPEWTEGPLPSPPFWLGVQVFVGTKMAG